MDEAHKFFSPTDALKCLGASVDSYISATVETLTAHALIARSDEDTLIVAFRGTQNIRDWLTDAQFLRRKLLTMEVHSGFWASFVTIDSMVRDALREAKRILITGHSLGGALAMLCAKSLDGAGFPVAGVYTFGQPRVGDKAFAAAYDRALGERTFRYINQEDIVPRLPGYLAGYRHAGNEWFIPVIGAPRLNVPLWTKALSDVLGLYKEWRQGRIALLADHFVKSYADKLGYVPGQIPASQSQISI